MRFMEIDRCPVPGGLGVRVLKLKQKVPGAHLNSCYRGNDAEGKRILRKNGKKSQQELYDCWQAREPGCNPANPPGRSTHECRSDGVVYAGPLGRNLRGWQCGMDWESEDVDRLISAGHSFAWELFRPYASGSEAHHLNFRIKPPWRWGRNRKRRPEHPTLRMGTRRRRATKRLQISLKNLGWHIVVDGFFGPATHRTVRVFQTNNHLVPDGVVGPRTWAKLLGKNKKGKGGKS